LNSWDLPPREKISIEMPYLQPSNFSEEKLFKHAKGSVQFPLDKQFPLMGEKDCTI
jgi:hypothetical protein